MIYSPLFLSISENLIHMFIVLLTITHLYRAAVNNKPMAYINGNNSAHATTTTLKSSLFDIIQDLIESFFN